MPIQLRKRLRTGFTLVELLIVVLIIVILAAIIAPQLSGAADDAKVAKLLAVTSAVRTAVQGHYNDTGQLARENTNSTATNQHELGLTQTTTNWRGPYLDHPLTVADNPFGGRIDVFENFNGDAGGGFDLMGSGSDTATGAGAYISFRNVPQSAAQAADSALDNGITGNWQTTGRVEWTNNQRLVIFLFDTPG